jgi:hypothetical protein
MKSKDYQFENHSRTNEQLKEKIDYVPGGCLGSSPNDCHTNAKVVGFKFCDRMGSKGLGDSVVGMVGSIAYYACI